MKVPIGEGLAPTPAPIHAFIPVKATDEGLTGKARAGLLSRERCGELWGADTVHKSGRQYRLHPYREMWPNPAWSETPCTHSV